WLDPQYLAPGHRFIRVPRDEALDRKHAEAIDQAALTKDQRVQLPALIGALAGAAGIALHPDVEHVPQSLAGFGDGPAAEELGNPHHDPGIRRTTRPAASSPRPRPRSSPRRFR